MDTMTDMLDSDMPAFDADILAEWEARHADRPTDDREAGE